jgi:hypothetical protein
VIGLRWGIFLAIYALAGAAYAAQGYRMGKRMAEARGVDFANAPWSAQVLFCLVIALSGVTWPPWLLIELSTYVRSQLRARGCSACAARASAPPVDVERLSEVIARTTDLLTAEQWNQLAGLLTPEQMIAVTDACNAIVAERRAREESRS